ncbi:MAG: LytTR family DNA-binding domain-containing protein [Flavobacteriaceae bacterium]|nr:LytTR family DNA-binding domain-containing protein [Flavobacteriaceae bacterium]
MPYKYLIIESEKQIIKNLKTSFKEFPNYSCIGISSCFDKSLDLILKHAPNVVFINIDAKADTGCLEAFKFVNELYKYVKEMPNLIALSSTTEHAYTCIKNNFFDYLLKPIKPFELRKIIAKLDKKPMQVSNTLRLKSYKDYRYIEIEDILFLKADNTATDFFMYDGTTISAYKTLKSFEAVLPENFTRIHNSYIVNQNYVSRIHFGKSKCSLKKSSFAIPFSKTYRGNVVILEKALSKRSLLSLN